MSWSGGKDSCVALDELLRSPDHEVVGLITTVTRDYDRISIHGVRRSLLAQQAEALGLPLHEVFIPAECSNDAYEAAMGEALARHREAGCTTVAFGDLFLADIRTYRDALMAQAHGVALIDVTHTATERAAVPMIAAAVQKGGIEIVQSGVDTNPFEKWG